MAVKVKTKVTHTGADAKKVASAFHEVMHNTPKIVQHTEQKFGAKRAHKQEVAIALSKARKAGASIPGPSGSNYVSPDDLHIIPGASTRTWKRGSERVAPTGQCEAGKNPSDLHNYPDHATVVGQKFPALHFGEAQVRHEIDMEVVQPVNRVMNPVEAVRKKNNAARDIRTNLGRGKAGIVVSEEDNPGTKGTW